MILNNEYGKSIGAIKHNIKNTAIYVTGEKNRFNKSRNDAVSFKLLNITVSVEYNSTCCFS